MSGNKVYEVILINEQYLAFKTGLYKVKVDRAIRRVARLWTLGRKLFFSTG